MSFIFQKDIQYYNRFYKGANFKYQDEGIQVLRHKSSYSKESIMYFMWHRGGQRHCFWVYDVIPTRKIPPQNQSVLTKITVL